MSSPLFDAIQNLLEKDRSSFHTPGHKGIGSVSLSYDMTELPTIEGLYESKGALLDTEEEFSRLYGCETILSAGGSTLCIQTMLAMAVGAGGEVIMGRGVHTSAVNTMALLDIRPQWMFPTQNRETALMNPITAGEVEEAIRQHPNAVAVYLTSPDYYGQNVDVLSISNRCKAHGKKLIIDNAHGAHYKFLSPSLHPMDLGADFACSSLHKTLPAMTGAALLHLGEGYSPVEAKRWMSLFGSTSPSYLILLSADGLLTYLREQGVRDIQNVVELSNYTKTRAGERGIPLLGGGSDPCRLTIHFGAVGYTQEEFSKELYRVKIEPEYTDSRYCVLIPTVANSERDWKRVYDLLEKLPLKEPLPMEMMEPPNATIGCSLREAVFAVGREVPVEESVGCIATATICPCPPGIPLVIPGEVIGEEMVRILKKSSFLKVHVL